VPIIDNSFGILSGKYYMLTLGMVVKDCTENHMPLASVSQ